MLHRALASLAVQAAGWITARPSRSICCAAAGLVVGSLALAPVSDAKPVTYRLHTPGVV